MRNFHQTQTWMSPGEICHICPPPTGWVSLKNILNDLCRQWRVKSNGGRVFVERANFFPVCFEQQVDSLLSVCYQSPYLASCANKGCKRWCENYLQFICFFMKLWQAVSNKWCAFLWKRFTNTNRNQFVIYISNRYQMPSRLGPPTPWISVRIQRRVWETEIHITTKPFGTRWNTDPRKPIDFFILNGIKFLCLSVSFFTTPITLPSKYHFLRIWPHLRPLRCPRCHIWGRG